MKLRNTEIGLQLIIEDELLNRLFQQGQKNYPKEFGGVLVGYYSEDKKTVFIKETVLPKKYKSSRTDFERGTDGLKEVLEQYYNQEPSLIYVGEWHTHPDNLPIPSAMDLKALLEIVNYSEVKIKNPVLLILGLDKEKVIPGFYVYFKNKIYKYEKV